MQMADVYSFSEKLQYSRGVSESTHPETIRKLIAGCVSVSKAPLELDRLGIDYVAELRRGAKVNIDLKSRDKGCSRHWRPVNPIYSTAREPELALEIWSVRPSDRNPKGRVGWTLDESKLTDYTLHIFDHSDTREVFLLPFQLLRMAFIRNYKTWRKQFSKSNGRDIQNSGTWESECVFVPAWMVLDAIADEMRQQHPVECFGVCCLPWPNENGGEDAQQDHP